MENEKIIGVIGGMGPYAGLDLVRKIFEETRAGTDQDHLPVAMFSFSHRIVDRTAYLMGEIDVNPAPAIAEVALQLERAGAAVAGMSCNSAHTPVLFQEIERRLRESGSGLHLINMIDETVEHLRSGKAGMQRIGVLSTNSIYHFGVYRHALVRAGFEPVLPGVDMQENTVHMAIYDPAYGIKAQSDPVTDRAKQNLMTSLEALRHRGAEAVILGCTELPLALTEPEIMGMPLIDPTRILARALIRATYPHKLRPLLESGFGESNGGDLAHRRLDG